MLKYFGYHFSQLINGIQISQKILTELKQQIQINNAKPSLAIYLVGNSPASKSYVNRKLKACQQVGIAVELHQFEDTIKQDTLIQHIRNIQSDSILVQLPLPVHIDRFAVINSIPKEKDADCLHMHNLQQILLNGEMNEMLPCTPAGVLAMLDDQHINLKGKKVTIIGRSLLVGMPLSLLLMKRNATVTICHKQTLNLENEIMMADIVISAAGHPKLVRDVKEGAIVIDIGINQGSTPKKIVGDVDFEKVKLKASLITPVPGGVGPMTVCMLMKNVYNIWCKKNNLTVQINPHLGEEYLKD